MAHLSTHVLDTAHGVPAAGMHVTLERLHDDGRTETVRTLVLYADGRSPGGPLLAGDAVRVGRWRLVFEVAAYYRARGVELPEPPFVDRVSLDFGIADAAGRYHVPMLVAPSGYSTYRGS